MKKLSKILLVLALSLIVLRGAYAQGVKHAILTASPFVVDDSIMIDFDGQIHEYK